VRPEKSFDEDTMMHPARPAAAPGMAAAAAAGAGAAMAAAAATRMNERVEPAREPSVAEKVKAAADKFDLDFQLDESEKPAPMRKPEPEPELATAAAGPSSGAADKLARPAAALELDKLDLSFDPEKATFEDPTPSVLDGQWHDAATKLDLAKAYQEMGDVEGAREILQEVLHEGDDEQKREAQGILAQLG
jgi:pilus assembly protein FimV